MQTESSAENSFPLYPPGPKNRNPLGFMRDVQRDPPQFLLRVAQEYGGVARFRAGFLHVYLIAHPDAVRHVLRDHHKNYSKNTFTYKMTRSVTGPGLLTMDGEQWLERRRILQPIFARERIANLDATVTDAMTTVLVRWRRQAAAGEPIDIRAEMIQLTLSIASKAFFDIDIGDEHDEIRRAMSTISTAFIHRFRSRLAAIWGILGFPALENRRLGLAKQALEKVAQQIIDELRRRGATPIIFWSNWRKQLIRRPAAASAIKR